jgi:antitoxin ParD1/3/4
MLLPDANPTIERAAAMPTRNVNLTDQRDHFIAKKFKSGRYENASEVVRAGLRTLEREEQQYEAKIVALRTAIAEGDASGIAKGNVFGGRVCDDIRPGLRRHEHGKQALFYRQERGGIFVSRILHQRMLPEKHVRQQDDEP